MSWVLRTLLLFLTPLTMAATADVSRYRIPITPSGTFTVSDSVPLPPLKTSWGMMTHFASNPVVWRYNDGTFDPVVSTQTFMEVYAATGIVDFVDVGVVIPVLLQQNGPATLGGLGDLTGAGIGDIRILPRLQISNEEIWGVGASFISEFSFGTGDQDRFVGNPGALAWRPTITASAWLDQVHFLGRAGIEFRSGAEVTSNLDLGSDLNFAVGADIKVVRQGSVPTSLLFELAGATAFNDFFGENQTALELMAGARALFFDGMVVTAGLAAGLLQGIGTPGYRVLLGVAYAPVPPDGDEDGVRDGQDECPGEIEDLDGFEDGDGCLDADNDDDGIEDIDDACIDTPEDINGYRDEDGCPDAGELDDDDDGIQNDEDPCPLDPEDFDGYEDDDGCPERDNDQDGVPDDQDICPDEEETINGMDDYDGCPDAGEGITRVLEKKIEIDETILFESGKALIKERSKRVLDQVALQILAHPYIIAVRIEGHTDSAGDENANLRLSQARAEAVRDYLVLRGVPLDKLEAQGFGEAEPIDTNDTFEGRARNRRVEFVIEQAE